MLQNSPNLLNFLQGACGPFFLEFMRVFPEIWHNRRLTHPAGSTPDTREIFTPWVFTQRVHRINLRMQPKPFTWTLMELS